MKIAKKNSVSSTKKKTPVKKSSVSKKSVPRTQKSSLPKVGSLAPDFTLKDQCGRMLNLRNLRGSPVVIYFYPKDDTPGCTIEAQGFRDDHAAFDKKGVVVFGISKDDLDSHCKFTDKYWLNFPLLSDPNAEVIKKYGCWVEKNNYGKKYMGIQRATFVIDANGYVMKVFPKVTPEGHSKEILSLFV